MALDSTVGGTGAESLASVDDADDYHAKRGNAAWAALTVERREQCLRLATDYMQGAYTAAWQGVRYTETQALDWPRDGVAVYGFDVSPLIVPPAVRDACAALALKAATAALAPDLGRAIKRSKVGPLETEYADYSPQSKRYLSVDRMLAPYLAEANPYAARLERG